MHVFFLLIAKLTEVAPKRHSAGFDSAGGFCATLRIVRGVLCNLPTQMKKTIIFLHKNMQLVSYIDSFCPPLFQ